MENLIARGSELLIGIVGGMFVIVGLFLRTMIGLFLIPFADRTKIEYRNMARFCVLLAYAVLPLMIRFRWTDFQLADLPITNNQAVIVLIVIVGLVSLIFSNIFRTLEIRSAVSK